MATPERKVGIAFATLAVGLLVGGANVVAQKEEAKRPRLNLRAQPAVGIAPVRIALTAELVGGANDFEEYYCPSVTWDWGDDTSSESTTDCAPYESGKTEIKRRFITEHTFRRSGAYKVYVRLKQHNKEVAATSTTVQVQPGAQEQY